MNHDRRKNDHPESGAFTLIEVLVVIGVIALLAAILLPVLTSARSAADSAGCRSNLRQLMLGMSIYVQQGGAYPQSMLWQDQLEPSVGASWPAANFDYISNSYLGPRQSVWACPGYNRVRGLFQGSQGTVSYFYNDFGVGDATYSGSTLLVKSALGGSQTSVMESVPAVFIPTRERKSHIKAAKG